MEELVKPTVYFRYRGEVNTARVLDLARQRALELGIIKMFAGSLPIGSRRICAAQ